MKTKRFRVAVVMAALVMNMNAQRNDSVTTDTAQWLGEVRELNEVVVKSTLPKTRVKGDAMRTTVAGSILEKA